jgi:uncharacterized protein (TIGR00661 family)
VKVFYGVQATGNGHITRARAMAPKLKQAGVDVTWMFTGRPWEQLFEMEVFGDYEWRSGLTFATKSGHVQYLQTVLENPLARFVRDVKNLDLSGYDLVVCDFEPVTAWAAKLQGIKTIGIGHQYAFSYDIPKAGADFLGEKVLRYFAPVSVGLGVHWHHFHHPILPPVIEREMGDSTPRPEKVIVYLPFEDVDHVIHLLKQFPSYEFYVYSPTHPKTAHEHPANVHVRQLSRTGFQKDFAESSAVISNAGFELASESLQTGKKILVKPLRGQMEQVSNALALELLQLGQVMQSLDSSSIATWLEQSRPIHVQYPDSAQAIVDWLLQGELRVDPSWVDGIWAQTIQTPL